MRPNLVRQAWSRGDAAINGWLSIPSSLSAEIMANQKFTSVTVDMQHGIIDYQVAVTMLQAMAYAPITPFVRVPWNDPASIMKALDAGAYGIICPMINSPEQAASLVNSCRYAPVGGRSWGPTRVSLWAGADYGARANDEIVVMPMIETAEALRNLDQILEVPGVDGVYVGPADLSLSMGGKAAMDQTDPKLLEILATIADACQRHRVTAGIHTGSAAYGNRMIAAGYRFITLGSDGRFLAAKMAEELAQLTSAPAAIGQVPSY
jgi:4-hydroxy-2-oxoheptanedioate aldolase